MPEPGSRDPNPARRDERERPDGRDARLSEDRRRQTSSEGEWSGHDGRAAQYEREEERQRGPEEWTPYRAYRRRGAAKK